MKDSRDIPTSLIESLKSLGLTKYEALVYIGLLRMAGATATETHEISGVPRASVYPVLDRLAQKELVSVSHTTPKRFDAVPPDRGIENLMRRIEEDAESARTALNKFYREKDLEGRGNQELIWSIYGEENIKTRLADMFQSAEQSVEILASWHLLEGAVLALLEPIPDSVQVDIVTDCWKGDRPRGYTIRVHAPETLSKLHMPHGKSLNHENSGVFLVDDARALVWLGSANEQSSALYSESVGLIQFVRRYLTSVTEWLETIAQ